MLAHVEFWAGREEGRAEVGERDERAETLMWKETFLTEMRDLFAGHTGLEEEERVHVCVDLAVRKEIRDEQVCAYACI
jgi:hypothetical protein